VVVIRDMRIVHKDDIHNALLYPLMRTQYRMRHRKCNICQIHRARKVTYEDKMSPQSPCFFCEYCYYLLHYSEDGRLLYDDFRVYDYALDP
jgi:snRNA-activating protein complex subunit 3